MQPIAEKKDYIHPQLGREVEAVGGHYVFGKERRITFSSREILYFVGYAVLDSTCCGIGGCAYVYVPGFICQWKYKKKEGNSYVSQIEPIRSHAFQKKVRDFIQKEEMVFQVTFD